MQEIWKDIKDYEGLYQISNYGRVKSLKRNGKIMSISIESKRTCYLKVNLSKNGKSKTFMIHRLVAIAFLPLIEGKEVVNHIDGNSLNNIVSNLRWCTAKENASFPIVRKRLGEAMKRRYKNMSQEERERENERLGRLNFNVDKRKKILQVDKKGNIVKKWDGIRMAESALGVVGITECLKKRKKVIGGFFWFYEEEKLEIESFVSNYHNYVQQGHFVQQVCQFSKDFKLIKTWRSIKEAEENLKLRHIGACCNGKKKNVGGFIWVFQKDKENVKTLYENISKKRGRYVRAIIQYDLNGNFIKEWEQINKAQKELGVHNIGLCCRGKMKHAGGYIWKYKEM